MQWSTTQHEVIIGGMSSSPPGYHFSFVYRLEILYLREKMSACQH